MEPLALETIANSCESTTKFIYAQPYFTREEEKYQGQQG
jgi:hypothetical protein